jgi:hypothetical protein
MNDSQYGLCASIWTTDVDAAIRIGDRVDTGTWFLNRCDYLDPALSGPRQGFRARLFVIAARLRVANASEVIPPPPRAVTPFRTRPTRPATVQLSRGDRPDSAARARST